jgi:membrane protein required for colicin V production
MLLDVIYILLLVFAIIRGFRRGLIVGVFSFVAIIVGLAAAIKLSAVVAGYIAPAVKVSDKWLPVLSFIAVFIVVVILIRLGANLLQKAAEASSLGWVNRLGGILFYVIISTIVYSIFIFYAEKTGVVGEAGISQSISYRFVRPWGPRVIDALGSLIPVFKNMFMQLEQFFGGMAQEIPVKS